MYILHIYHWFSLVRTCILWLLSVVSILTTCIYMYFSLENYHFNYVLYVHVCIIYVCMYVHVCMYVCLYVHVCICTCVYNSMYVGLNGCINYVHSARLFNLRFNVLPRQKLCINVIYTCIHVWVDHLDCYNYMYLSVTEVNCTFNFAIFEREDLSTP